MTLGDLITWSTFVVGLPAVLVWLWRVAEVSSVWRAVRIAYLRAYVAWEARQADTEDGDTSIDTGMYQVEPATQPAAPPAQMTERAVIVWLAEQKTLDGAWRFSANAIYALLRGNRNDVLEIIRGVRAGAAAHADDAPVTPFGGRPYNPAAYHTDEPELAYHAPPQAEEM